MSRGLGDVYKRQSIGYTNFRINQYDKLICEHIKDTSQVTFDMLLELLKKVGIIKN